jgi:ribosomal protein S18 acetylase RimI-like enzyme
VAGGQPVDRAWSHQSSVAVGELDICVWFCGDIWDHAAPSVLVEEAGGRFSDHEGGKRLGTRTAIYSNGLRHDEVLPALADVRGSVASEQVGPSNDALPGVVKRSFWHCGSPQVPSPARANSALALETNERVEELVARAERFYGERRAPVLIQVSSASAPPGLGTHLQTRGYCSTARTLVMSAVTPEVLERTRSSSCEVEVTERPSDGWFDTYWSVEATRGRSVADMELCRGGGVLLAPVLPMTFAAARRGSEVLGVGQLVIERGWGGVQCVATAPAQRRQGVAKAVLRGLAEEAERREVQRMYLAVMANNDGATALYGSAGFKAVHEYSYFVAQPG